MAMVYVGANHVPPREFLASMLSAAHPGVHDFAFFKHPDDARRTAFFSRIPTVDRIDFLRSHPEDVCPSLFDSRVAASRLPSPDSNSSTPGITSTRHPVPALWRPEYCCTCIRPWMGLEHKGTFRKAKHLQGTAAPFAIGSAWATGAAHTNASPASIATRFTSAVDRSSAGCPPLCNPAKCSASRSAFRNAVRRLPGGLSW